MRSLSVQILDWAARAPGRESKAAWHAWAGAPIASEDMPPPASTMPMMLRRRAGKIGQQAIAAAYQVGPPPGARYIFCSRHGDFQRTAALLHAVAAGEPLSPAEFSVSVHNALAGLLSIATGSTAGHTAIAAGPDSFACGLIEAAATLAEAPDTPILLVYYDETPPSPYDELAIEGGEPLAVAVMLGAASPGTGRSEIIEIIAAPGRGPAASTTGAAFDFLRFLASGAASAHSPGERVDLEWRRAG